MKSTTLTPKRSRARSFYETFGLLAGFHLASWIIYTFLLSTLENQMLGDELEPSFRWVMFGYSVLCMTVYGILSIVLYRKDGNRNRAFLAATSVSDLGAEAAAEGHKRYRSVPLVETLFATLAPAILWLPELILYSISVFTSGAGYGYASALFLEDLFISFVGFCQPFQNAFVGYVIGLAYIALFQYLGRRSALRAWHRDRIRP